MDLSEGMLNLSLRPPKTSYLHYENVYAHQNWMVTYHKGFPLIELHKTFIIKACEIMWLTKNIISPLPSGCDHQTSQTGNLDW